MSIIRGLKVSEEVFKNIKKGLPYSTISIFTADVFNVSSEFNEYRNDEFLYSDAQIRIKDFESFIISDNYIEIFSAVTFVITIKQ